MRPELADQPTSGSARHVEVHQAEAALRQRRQRVALGQPGVDEAEPRLVDAEDLAGPVHLGPADLGDVLASTSGRSSFGLSTLPRSPPVQVDDQHVDALGDVAGHGRGALARLVVGVRVHRHQAQLLSHRTPSTVHRAGRSGRD